MPRQSERVRAILEEKESIEEGDLFVVRVRPGEQADEVSETLAEFAERHGVRFLVVPHGVELEHLDRDELRRLGYRWVGAPDRTCPGCASVGLCGPGECVYGKRSG